MLEAVALPDSEVIIHWKQDDSPLATAALQVHGLGTPDIELKVLQFEPLPWIVLCMNEI